MVGGPLVRKGFSEIGGVVDDIARRFTTKHPVSTRVLKKPIEEMTATYSPMRSTMKEDRIITPEALEGGTVLSVGGDRSLAGRRLLKVGDDPVDVNLHGGYEFARDNPTVWASDRMAMNNLDKRINRAFEETQGDPVYLMYHAAFGGEGGDFSYPMAEILRQRLAQRELDPELVKTFDTAMRMPWTEFTASEDFPGIKNLTSDWLLQAGGDRSKFAKLLSQKTFDPFGVDVPESRWALTDPALMNVDPGGGGMMISRVHPGERLVSGGNETYNTEVIGDLMGRFSQSVPWELTLPDHAAQSAAKPLSAKGRPPNPIRALQINNVAQRYGPETVDRIMQYLNSPEGRMRGAGGLVGAGILTGEQMRDIFGAEEMEAM